MQVDKLRFNHYNGKAKNEGFLDKDLLKPIGGVKMVLLKSMTRALLIGIAILVILFVLLFPVFVWFALGHTTTKMVLFSGGIAIDLLIMISPVIVWFWLAPTNRFFTFVKEGTAKIVVKADQFHSILMQWQGWTLDDEYNVVPNGTVKGGKTYREPWHPLGGLRYYGPWPLLDVFLYRLRWNDVHQTEEKDGKIVIAKFHDERLDYVLLRPAVYLVKTPKAETKPPERFPLDVEFLVTMQVVNPHKVIFVAPLNWVENVTTRLEAMFRGFVGSKKLDELILFKGKSRHKVWELFKNDPFLRFLEQDWGVKIVDNGIQIKDISPEAEYQKAAAAEREETMRAAGEAARINIVYKAIEGFGDLGKLVRTLEAMEVSPEKGAKWVIPLPGGTDLIQEVLGRPAGDREDVREVLDLIKRALEAQQAEK